MNITRRFLGLGIILLAVPLAAMGAASPTQVLNRVLKTTATAQHFQAQVQAAYQKFPVLLPVVDAQNQPGFEKLALTTPVAIDGTETFGFRIQVPKRKDQDDFAWTYVQPNNAYIWGILPLTGNMTGFDDFSWKPRNEYLGTENLTPVPGKNVIVQSLPGDRLKDEQTYIIWFAFGSKHPANISLKYTFAKLGPRKIQDVSVLEKTLALTLRNPPPPPPPPLPNSQFPGNPYGSGSGFFATDDGYFVTCNHVVDGADQVKVKVGDKMLEAKVVKADKVNDVALLKVDTTVDSLPILSSDEVKLGESVFTIGFPNIQMQGVSPKLTKGDINSLAGIQDDPHTFQISVAIQPGNSGGPLVDQNGNVVGIIKATLSTMVVLEETGSLPQNVNYAVKSSAIRDLLAGVPDLAAKLKISSAAKDGTLEDAIAHAQKSVALVLVY